MVKTVVYSLWLPIAVLLVSYARFGITGNSDGLGIAVKGLRDLGILFAIAWPCGIPLTLAVRLLYQRARIPAYLCAGVLGPLSAFAVIVGGLLGPIGIGLYVVAVSLPAWIVLGVTKLLRPRHA